MKRLREIYIAILILLASCAASDRAAVGFGNAAAGTEPGAGAVRSVTRTAEAGDAEAFDSALSEALSSLAEQERRGRYAPGLGITESRLLERAGDTSGAVLAVFKDFVYGYSYGRVDRAAILDRLDTLEEAYPDAGPSQDAKAAIRCVRAFVEENWPAALRGLRELPRRVEARDAFRRWMEAAALLAQGRATRDELDDYAVMQSRYSSLPEYWYRFAVAQANAELRRDSAFRCIALAPDGPWADGARSIVADSYGLDGVAGRSLLIPGEIEAIASEAIKAGDPTLLAGLMPSLSLPDNESTMYAVATLKGLCVYPVVREWLLRMSASTSGRTSERLRYIVGR